MVFKKKENFLRFVRGWHANGLVFLNKFWYSDIDYCAEKGKLINCNNG